MKCIHILALFTLFLLGSFSIQVALIESLQDTIEFVSANNPDQTMERNAVKTYHNFLYTEAFVLAMTGLVSWIVGYLYEIWRRRTVIIILVVINAIGMLLPELFKKDKAENVSRWHGLTRLATAVVSEAIMSNPLLSDYVKKHSHGWAHAIQFIGYQIGSIAAFYVSFKGLHREYKSLVYYLLTSGVLVTGLITAIFMVKEIEVKRVYQKDVHGKLVRK